MIVFNLSPHIYLYFIPMVNPYWWSNSYHFFTFFGQGFQPLAIRDVKRPKTQSPRTAFQQMKQHQNWNGWKSKGQSSFIKPHVLLIAREAWDDHPRALVISLWKGL